MTTIVLTKERGSRFAAAELGSMNQRSWFTSDFEVAPLGGAALTFHRSGWGRRYRALDATGHVVGERDHLGFFERRGPISWDGVAYDFGTQSQWKGSMVLLRYGEELSHFRVDGWGRKVTIETPNAAALPPGLLLFGAWMTILQRRDTAAAAS